VSMIISI